MRTIANKRREDNKYLDWNILDCVDFSDKYTRVSENDENLPLVFIEDINAHEDKIDIFKWLKSIIRIKK